MKSIGMWYSAPSGKRVPEVILKQHALVWSNHFSDSQVKLELKGCFAALSDRAPTYRRNLCLKLSCMEYKPLTPCRDKSKICSLRKKRLQKDLFKTRGFLHRPFVTFGNRFGQAFLVKKNGKGGKTRYWECCVYSHAVGFFCLQMELALLLGKAFCPFLLRKDCTDPRGSSYGKAVRVLSPV